MHPGVEVVLVAQDVLVSPREERFGAPPCWSIVVGDSCSFSRGSFPFCQAEEAGHPESSWFAESSQRGGWTVRDDCRSSLSYHGK